MGAISKMTDTFYALRFLRLLTMPWEKTAAYKEGIIDDEGKKIKDPQTTPEKSAYTLFHRLVFNVRRMFNRLPSSLARRLSTYAAALFLIREHYDLGPGFETLVESRLNLIGRTGASKQTTLEPIFEDAAIVGEALGITLTREMVEEVSAGTMSVGSFSPQLDKRIVGVSNKTFRRMRTGQNTNWKKRIKDEEDLIKVNRAMESYESIILQCNDSGAMLAVKNTIK